VLRAAQQEGAPALVRYRVHLSAGQYLQPFAGFVQYLDHRGDFLVRIPGVRNRLKGHAATDCQSSVANASRVQSADDRSLGPVTDRSVVMGILALRRTS